SKEAKQSLILSYLRDSRTCHTLKDLEKSLPSVASINAMHVKEYIQALTDENLLHVEKIGSGNWYWSFASEEKKQREKRKAELTKEVDKVKRGWEEVSSELEKERKKRKGSGPTEADQEGKEEREIDELIELRARLEMEIGQLRSAEKALAEDEGGKGVDAKRADIRRWKEAAQTWTDNIYILEEYVLKVAGGDREVVDALKRECYGVEYVEGEGLREIF
ncbi:hypothetical protein ASPZODRAFT_65293, partial [Penicilliopsis zonata CBS 506.65]